MPLSCRWLTLVGSATLLAIGCATTGADPSRDRRFATHLQDARADIEAANRELSRRMEAGDLPGVAAMYADDAVLLGPNGYRVSGRAAIDEYWSTFHKARRWKLDVLDVEGGEGLFVQRGRSTLMFEEEGGTRDAVVEFIVVWRKEPDGAYRVVVDAYWPTKPR